MRLLKKTKDTCEKCDQGNYGAENQLDVKWNLNEVINQWERASDRKPGSAGRDCTAMQGMTWGKRRKGQQHKHIPNLQNKRKAHM